MIASSVFNLFGAFGGGDPIPAATRVHFTSNYLSPTTSSDVA